MKRPTLRPGSQGAVLAGCVCDKALNHGGFGYGTRDRFLVAEHCPMHGLAVPDCDASAVPLGRLPTPDDVRTVVARGVE